MNKREQDLEQHDDEISLFDLWDTLRSGWRLVLGCTALGFIGAGAAVAVLPAKYEAVSLITVGQVAAIRAVGGGGQATLSTPIEPAVIAVERIKSPAFQLEVAQTVGDKEWHKALEKSAAATSKYFTVTTVKNSAAAGREPLIELRVKAASTDQAKMISETAVKELIKRHDEIAQPLIGKLNEQLAVSKQKLERITETLNKLEENSGAKEDRSMRLSVMMMSDRKETEAARERDIAAKLEEALSPPNTQATRALEDTFVASAPVFPKTGLLLGGGLIGGLMLGVLAVFTLAAWRRAVRERAARRQATE